MSKVKVTEEMNEHLKWYIAAKEQTLETLPDFLKILSESYELDYGTVVHAVTASALAAAWAFNASEQGGITGFQAGHVMWKFIREWQHLDSPLKLLDYNNMLYPQYEDTFEKIISKETWEYLQEKAKSALEDASEHVPDHVLNHWRSIVVGQVPFGYIVKEEE